jgi:hypothetical protein
MAAKHPPTYPFVPRSATALTPGQFWAIPLSDGTFCCGRVIETKPPGSIGARVSFLAGVLDWHDEQPPTFDAIAGTKCLDQGQAHLKIITESGHVHQGLQPIRPQEPMDHSLPVLSTWGYRIPAIIAEARFIKAKE